MTLTRVRAVPAGFINPDDDRKLWNGISPREGLLPDPISTAAAGIAFAGTGWGVSARAFNAVLRRGTAPYALSYGSAFACNDGTVTNAWTIGAAPTSGTRVDLLCIRARDITQGDSSAGAPTDGPSGAARNGFAEWVVVPGTAGTPGTRPALPAGYEEIAQITTPSGPASTSGSTIVHTYAFAHVIGGPIYVRSLSERNALTGLIPGDRVALAGTDVSWVKTSTGWTGGSVRAGYVAQNTDANGFVTVSHPYGELPIVTPAPGPVNGHVDANSRLFEPVVWDRTVNEFTIRFIRRDTNQWVDAQAVRMSYLITSPTT